MSARLEHLREGCLYGVVAMSFPEEITLKPTDFLVPLLFVVNWLAHTDMCVEL